MTEPAAPKRTHWIVRLFAILGIMAVIVLVLIIVAVRSLGPRHGPAEIADKTGKVAFVVGGVTHLAGTDLIQMRISASREKGGYSSYYEDDTRNILLVDRQSGSSRRLLPNNDRRIDAVRFLPDEGDRVMSGVESVEKGTAGKTRAEYYVVVIDQAGDGRKKDVLVGTLAARKQATVMQSIDGIDEMWMQTPKRIGMVVRDRSSLYYRVVDVPALKLVSSARIPVD